MAVQTENVAHTELVSGGNTSLHSHALPAIPVTKRVITSNQVINSGYSAYVTGYLEIALGFSLEIASDACFEIG